MNRIRLKEREVLRRVTDSENLLLLIRSRSEVERFKSDEQIMKEILKE